MNPLVAYLWPSVVFGAVMGAVSMTIVYRRRPGRIARWIILDAAVAMAVLGSLVWSGPLGGGRRFINQVEHTVRLVLDAYEMNQITGRLGRAPLNRQVILEGPADDFQRSELVQIMANVPGVRRASWGYSGGALPIIVEGALAAVGGFLLGLVLAYLLEWHRRYNAQWNW